MTKPSTEPTSVGVSCKNINLSFEKRPLFQNFSLEFKPGLCTCLLGPSGCGKSTLLSIISGAKSFAYSGEVSFSGQDKAAGTVAWMSQEDLLLPWMRVIDNIMLGAKLRGENGKDIRQKAQELLSSSEMAGTETAYPAILSGGMRQRVALLRTLMEERPVLLMDEPFSALDALTRLKLQDLSAQLTKGKTVILVTHDPMEALRLGDRIIVLGGAPVKIVADIKPEGDVPRESGSELLARQYPKLLKILLTEARI